MGPRAATAMRRCSPSPRASQWCRPELVRLVELSRLVLEGSRVP